MGELKSKMVNHVRSAQKWLNRAEQAFESEKNTRGKLDLMLAQAEMQHLHESAVKGKSFSLIKQAIAFSVAAVLFSGGISGAYFYFHHSTFQPDNQLRMADSILPSTRSATVTALPDTGSSGSSAVSSSINDTTASTVAVPSVQQSTAATVVTTVPSRDETSRAVVSATADREVAMPQVVRPEEMQKLIRAAGKSLRGQ